MNYSDSVEDRQRGPVCIHWVGTGTAHVTHGGETITILKKEDVGAAAMMENLATIERFARSAGLGLQITGEPTP